MACVYACVGGRGEGQIRVHCLGKQARRAQTHCFAYLEGQRHGKAGGGCAPAEGGEGGEHGDTHGGCLCVMYKGGLSIAFRGFVFRPCLMMLLENSAMKARKCTPNLCWNM